MRTPIILREESFDPADLANLRRQATTLVDLRDKQLHELFVVTHPPLSDDQQTLSQFLKARGHGRDDLGAWVFFPWMNTLVHLVGEDDFVALRTNRNRDLISHSEQAVLRSARVGIAGMSVGAGIAVGCAYSGISDTIKIADLDFADTTNMNRLEVGVQDLYQSKVVLAARRIYEANPFAEVLLFENGLDEGNLRQFFADESELDLVVDEVDDFKLKIQLRTMAREQEVPLIMMTSLGDNVLIDIERYDVDREVRPFLGRAEEAVKEIEANPDVSSDEIVRYSADLVERQHIPIRALNSLREMGKTLVGRPQLFSTVATNAGLATMVIRHILMGGSEPVSGRYFMDLSSLIADSSPTT